MRRLLPTYLTARAVLALAAMLALACVAIVAIGRLQDDATTARDAQFELVSLRLDLAQIQQVPWGAAPDEGDSASDVRDELLGDEQDIEHDLAKLERMGGLPNRAKVDVPFERTMSALWRIFYLVSNGRSDETNKASDTAARQAAVADQALERAAVVDRGRSLHALRQARIESGAVILLLFLAFALVYRRATKARRKAEELAADNRRLLAASQAEALTDQLTGIGNRRALMADLETIDPPGEGQQTLLALFDLDGFKQYNDSFGHPAGDAVLELLGRRLADAIADHGSAYRMGGDEFCVLATVAEEEAEHVAAHAASELSEKGVGFTIVCSYGTALMPLETSDPRDALRLADQRMYEHKHSRVSAARASA
jgi:diguanylate cyclase (GGDEF)-like protein